MLILFQACALIPVLIVTAKMLKSKNKANEKELRGAKTLHAGCTKAEPKKVRPAADPLPGVAGRSKSNQLEMVTTFTYRPSLVRIDARNFELSW